MRGLTARVIFFALMFFILVGALQSRAFAYADPGTGLLAVQYFFSLLAGAVVYFRRSVLKFLGFSAHSDRPEQK